MNAALLSLLLSTASAAPPRVLATEDGVELSGLPAISADGTTIAMPEDEHDPSDASVTAVRFVRVRDGVQTDRFVVVQVDDAGRHVTDVSDGRGRTAWRRAKNVTAHLVARGYESFEIVDENALGAPLVGAGLRVAGRRGQVTVTNVRDRRVRWTGRLPAMRAFCGMSDERPRDVPPRIHSAWVDERGTTLLLEYGHVYGSCMCPADLATMIVPLAP